jgi:hypothetical protein
MIVDYQILETITIEKMEVFVRDYIREGWEPIGGISCDGDWYQQAMIKRATTV